MIFVWQQSPGFQLIGGHQCIFEFSTTGSQNHGFPSLIYISRLFFKRIRTGWQFIQPSLYQSVCLRGWPTCLQFWGKFCHPFCIALDLSSDITVSRSVYLPPSIMIFHYDLPSYVNMRILTLEAYSLCLQTDACFSSTSCSDKVENMAVKLYVAGLTSSVLQPIIVLHLQGNGYTCSELLIIQDFLVLCMRPGISVTTQARF